MPKRYWELAYEDLEVLERVEGAGESREATESFRDDRVGVPGYESLDEGDMVGWYRRSKTTFGSVE